MKLFVTQRSFEVEGTFDGDHDDEDEGGSMFLC
jgi:hypothetical protein